MPALLLPQKGRYGLRDYEKMFCTDANGGHDIFEMRGIDREAGCMVVVRPDQYVAWRGNALPDRLDSLIDTLVGRAGSRTKSDRIERREKA